MPNQIAAKLRAAGFSQAELDAPDDNDRLLLGLAGDVVTLDDLIGIRQHFADGRRFELAFQRCKLDGRLAWSGEVDKYVRQIVPK